MPPGYQRKAGGALESHPQEAEAVAQAFRLRAGGATIMDVRDHLRAHGIDRTFHGVQALLGSRIVLGEIRFGSIFNAAAQTAIVDVATWTKVQQMRVSRGRRANLQMQPDRRLPASRDRERRPRGAFRFPPCSESRMTSRLTDNL